MSQPTEVMLAPRKPRRAKAWGWFWAQVLRTLSATWSQRHEGFNILDKLMAENQPHILTFWHRKFITLFPLLRGRKGCVVTADSPPGDVIAAMCDRFGYDKIQIPDRGCDHSLQLMQEAFAQSMSGSIAVDGPHGPYHVVKRGAIQLASHLGYLVVPVSVATRRKFVLSRRWDQLEIPGMFTRVSLVVGEPIRVPPGMVPEELPEWTQRLHDVLEELDERAECKVRGK